MMNLTSKNYSDSTYGVAQENLNLFYANAEFKMSQVIGAKKGDLNVFAVDMLIWETNKGIIAEQTIQISGNDIYEAANKVIAKVGQMYSIELEIVTR